VFVKLIKIFPLILQVTLCCAEILVSRVKEKLLVECAGMIERKDTDGKLSNIFKLCNFLICVSFTE
jgi:hypothetical protein